MPSLLDSTRLGQSIMFSSSLRKRQEWAPVIHSLKSSSTSTWKETPLENCDITFPVFVHNPQPVEFRVIVSSLSEIQSEEEKTRVERLSLANGREHIAMMLLLNGENFMDQFSQLQVEMFCSESPVPVIPISTIQDTPSCLESLRQDYNNKDPILNVNQSAAHKDLVSRCVDGKPLAKHQVNILTGITSRFRDLADLSTHLDGQSTICEYLGDDDGGRIISFLTNNPSHVHIQHRTSDAHAA